MQFITYLPTHYNDGTQVPESEIQDIIRELFDAFGGATISGTVEGYWKDTATGQAFTDESWRVEIATERERLAEVQTIVLEIGKRLRQEAMYLEVRYYDGVQILRVT
jgi:hypothetical protein